MGSIEGKRVVVDEDDSPIREVIAETIVDAGGFPLKPVLIERGQLDMSHYNPGVPNAAIPNTLLDGMSFTRSARLQNLGVPFIFASGQCHNVSIDWLTLKCAKETYTAGELLTTLERAVVIAQH